MASHVAGPQSSGAKLLRTMAAASVLRGAFDPESVKPADFEFPSAKGGDKKRRKETKEPEGEGRGSGKLPKRIPLEAFSESIGWRPSGLQSGQPESLFDRVPATVCACMLVCACGCTCVHATVKL